MARLCKHGSEIGTVYLTTAARRYMSDGVVLKNQGFGWKIHGKVKAGLSPQDAFNQAFARQESFLRDRPAVAAYRHELHAMTGLCNRWKLHAAIQLMPDDPDGAWSEACDGYGDNVSADVDDVAKLCQLYKAAIAESREMVSETA